MPGDYTVAEMIADIIAVIQENMLYVVPAAILISAVAFVVAWFMDSIDIAGKTFGRHR